MYPKTIIPRCRICKIELPPDDLKWHVLKCAKETPVFDCEGTPTEEAGLAIDSIYEYHGHVGVINYLNSPKLPNTFELIFPPTFESFLPWLLWESYKTILKSYIEAVHHEQKYFEDKNIYKTAVRNVFSTIDKLLSSFQYSDFDPYYEMNLRGESWFWITVGSEEGVRISFLASLFQDKIWKSIIIDKLKEFRDGTKYMLSKVLNMADEKLNKRFHGIRPFVQDLKEAVPEMFTLDSSALIVQLEENRQRRENRRKQRR